MAAEAYPFDLDVCQRCQDTFRRPTPEMLGGLAVKPELRVVYRSPDGRAFMTRRGAYNRYAWFRVKERHPCDCDEDEACWMHLGRVGADHKEVGSAGRLHERFVRWLLWHDRETRLRGRSPFAPTDSPGTADE